MNPLDYTFYTLNAKQFLIEPESKLPEQRAEKQNYSHIAVFIVGISLGQLIQFF